MDQKFNTSFIPKKFLGENMGASSGGAPFVARRSVMGPGYYLAILAFIIAVVASAGVLAYTKLTQQRISSLIQTLQEQTGSINVAEVESFIQLNKRFTNATEILNQHVAVSGLLTALEGKTLQDIRYTALTYTGEGDGASQGATLSGEAPDLEQVALQAAQFQSADSLHTPTVTSLKRTDEGKIGFEIHVDINPKLVSYGLVIQRTAGRAQQVQPAAQQDQGAPAPKEAAPKETTSAPQETQKVTPTPSDSLPPPPMTP